MVSRKFTHFPPSVSYERLLKINRKLRRINQALKKKLRVYQIPYDGMDDNLHLLSQVANHTIGTNSRMPELPESSEKPLNNPQE